MSAQPSPEVTTHDEVTPPHEPQEVHFEPAHPSRDDQRPEIPYAAMACTNVDVYYGDFRAVTGVNPIFGYNETTALIGPSGCGKSTLLRSLNRMNDLILGAHDGEVTLHGQDIYARGVDPIEVRRRIGMVFQKPNPFPKSIYDNVAYGPRVIGMKPSNMDDLVEEALTQAALWSEVKDKLKQSAFGLSGGQQQRLCIARTIAVRPEVILMDEPCSALDPIATGRIQDLMEELRQVYAIVIVTLSNTATGRPRRRSHSLLHWRWPPKGAGTAPACWSSTTRRPKSLRIPAHKRTEDYISGRFG